MFSRKFDRMNLIVLSSVILFWKNRGNETKKEPYEEEGKEVDVREDVSILLILLLSIKLARIFGDGCFLFCVSLFSQCVNCGFISEWLWITPKIQKTLTVVCCLQYNLITWIFVVCMCSHPREFSMNKWRSTFRKNRNGASYNVV